LLTGSRLKVLVIDDERTVADTLVLVLNYGGFDAVATYSGEDGLQLAKHGGYNYMITDVMMEPMNGIQVAIAMRALCPDCKILLMSGNEQTAALLAAAERDGHQFDIFAKPIHPSYLFDFLHGSSASDATQIQ